MNKHLIHYVIILGLMAGYLCVYGWPVRYITKVERDFFTIEYHTTEPTYEDDIGVKHLTVKDIERVI